MNIGQLKERMAFLGLAPLELAGLLDINIRTVQRWLAGTADIPTTTECVLDAWSSLQRFGLPWRPDGDHFLMPFDAHRQIELHKQNSIELANVIKKVKARGGAAAPWTVNLSTKRATLEKMWVSFYLLPNGTFSPQSYGRADKKVDTARDKELLEDAFVCIAEAIALERKKQLEAKWDVVNV